MDYYALLIFFHRGDKELLQEFTEDLVSIYNDLPKSRDGKWGDGLNRSFYKYLKLYGCWLSLSYRLKETFPSLFNALVTDFREVTHPGSPYRLQLLRNMDTPINMVQVGAVLG